MRRLLWTLGFMLVATNALACQFEDRLIYRVLQSDKPISVAADGSFKYAEGHDPEDLFGGKIFDLGNQRVAQRVTSGGFCSHTESLLFADCRTAEVVAVYGLEDPERGVGLGAGVYIDLIQVPLGAIDVAKITSVEELVSIAHEHGYSVNFKVERNVAAMRPRNRYDPFNGCKIYYPESHGATG